PAVEPPVEAAFAATIPEIEKKPAMAFPKQTPKNRGNVARRANDRLVQRSAERHGSSWDFSSSPASPNSRYRMVTPSPLPPIAAGRADMFGRLQVALES